MNRRWSSGVRYVWMPRGIIVDPQLRGRVTPRIVDGLRARGLHVHRVGAAAYLHDELGDVRIITAVLDRRATAPTWSSELDAGHRFLRGRGRPTLRQAVELRRRVAAWRRLRIRGARGRFVGRPDWWQDVDGRPLVGLLAPPTSRPSRRWTDR